jgi:hypothetical protein
MTFIPATPNKKIFFPTHTYYKQITGATPGSSVTSTRQARKIGFYEIIKIDIFGNPLTHHFIRVNTPEHFKKESYPGRTLMISIENSQLTNVHREATEKDKIKYKAAYQLFLDTKTPEIEEPAIKRKYERKAQIFKDEISPKDFEFIETENNNE